MHALFARWRISLRRTRADWPIVAAAALITLLATVLFAAGPIYSSAAALAGLRRTLADAPATDTSVQISLYGAPDYVEGVDNQEQSYLQAALEPLSAELVRDGQAAATLALPAAPGVQTHDRAAFGFLDGLSNHAHLTQGAWPASGNASDPLQVVVLDAVASALNLSIGDHVTLTASNVGKTAPVPVQIVGTFAVNDPDDPYWYGEDQLTTGIVQSGSDRVLGPFLTTPIGVLQNPALTAIHMQWRAFPDFRGLTVDNVAAIHSQLDALPGRVQATTTGSLAVATGLPDILGAAEQSLLVSRTEVLLLMAQLAVMAAYAILLTASLLVDHRRVETALLRSRGTGAGSIAFLAFAEGLLLVVPAVLIAPWLAVAQTTILAVAGPLADIGLKIEPTVTVDSYALAAAAGVICLALLVLPAFLSARNLTSEERDLSRQETRTIGHRLGLDVALLIVSVIALWQLRLYGAPLTRTVQGSLGFDPLLVAAPAIGLLAGAILALRVLPILAAVFERLVNRGREIVASLGSRQLARRPLRYTRTALLLMLALALGVFALSYSATWSDSQQDQAAYQAGADVRATVARGATTAPMLHADYAAVQGVEQAMPVERIKSGVTLAKGSVDLLALDADSAASIVTFRADEASQSLDQLMGALRTDRPAPTLVALPPDTSYLQITSVVDISEIAQLPDFSSNSDETTPIDPSTLTGVTATASAIVRDAHGLLYRVASAPAPVADSAASIVLPLSPASTAGQGQPGTGKLDGPFQIAGLEFDLTLPNDTITTDARIGVTGVSAGTDAAGPWAAVPVEGWSARLGMGRSKPDSVGAVSLDGMVVTIDNDGGLVLFGGAPAGRFIFIPSDLDSFDGAVPVVANSAFVNTTGTGMGQSVDVTIDGISRKLSIAGTVDSFPTTDPTHPLLVFDQPTLDLLRLQATATARPVDEWWLSVAPGTALQVADTLQASPFNSTEVVSADARTRSLSTDPVALGIIGALLLGFVATGIFALVALVVSAAVSARQRRTEFALLRALGLSGRQLSGWLWLENASVVVVSLIAGTIIGVVISLIALPFITVTQQATTPVPGVLVQLPWDRILALDIVVLAALVIAVGVLAFALRRIGVGSILRLGED
ncbi:MAG TPA: ABC transporter permease [Candidatus Limnocylindrales bacterium]